MVLVTICIHPLMYVKPCREHTLLCRLPPPPHPDGPRLARHNFLHLRLPLKKVFYPLNLYFLCIIPLYHFSLRFFAYCMYCHSPCSHFFLLQTTLADTPPRYSQLLYFLANRWVILPSVKTFLDDIIIQYLKYDKYIIKKVFKIRRNAEYFNNS